MVTGWLAALFYFGAVATAAAAAALSFAPEFLGRLQTVLVGHPKMSRSVAAFLPALAAVLFDQTQASVVAFAMLPLAFWLAARALQVILPAQVTMRGFVAVMRPNGDWGLIGHVFRFLALNVVNQMHLYVEVKGVANEQFADRKNRHSRRDQVRNAMVLTRAAMKLSLGFSTVHWLFLMLNIVGVVLTGLLGDRLAFVGPAVSVPACLLGSAALLYGRRQAVMRPLLLNSKALVLISANA